MRLRNFLAFGMVSFAGSVPDVALGEWRSAPYRGESKKTVQGCAKIQTDESFLCVLVRCEKAEKLSLYVLAAGLGAIGSANFNVDGASFPVSISTTPNSPIPDAHRSTDFPAGLREAMKTGRTLRIAGTSLTPGFDVVSLQGAGPAISRVEKGCGSRENRPSQTQIKYGPNGRIEGVSNLVSGDGCFPIKIKGRIVKRHYGPPGASFVGVDVEENRGPRQFINVDNDYKYRNTGSGHVKEIAGALDTLLTVGVKVELGVYQCGAAGRVLAVHSIQATR